MALFEIFVAFVAIFNLLATELPPDDSVSMLALLVAMPFVFVVISCVFCVIFARSVLC